MSISPCKECKLHGVDPYCHGKCEAYLEWVEKFTQVVAKNKLKEHYTRSYPIFKKKF